MRSANFFSSDGTGEPSELLPFLGGSYPHGWLFGTIQLELHLTLPPPFLLSFFFSSAQSHHQRSRWRGIILAPKTANNQVDEKAFFFFAQKKTTSIHGAPFLFNSFWS
jgi:hypothetical protein